MRIKLLNLKLKNFKGVKDFELDAQGQNVRIYGDNGTGKTTLADAFSWLLFDKDSQGQSTQSFEIKTLDENNEPIHGLEHQVEGALEVDGKQIILKKVYYEKWTKKRGSATKVFEGHTTDYYINDVPVKKKEYDARIAEIIDEEIFKMLTDPGYFNEQLHWEDRRKILLEVVGNISDEEVIAADEKLDRLSEVLNERTIEEHKKTVKSKQKKINKELEKIPVRIDEVNQNLPDITGIDVEKVEQELATQRKMKKKKEQVLARLESGGELAEKKKQLAEIETELQQIRNEHTAEYNEKIEQEKKKLYAVKDKIADIIRKIDNIKRDIQSNKRQYEKLEKEREKLREKWFELEDKKKAIDAETFEHDETCPTCGQALPEDQIEEARATFNRDKAEKIEKLTQQQQEITQEGQEHNKEIGGLRGQNKDLEFEIEELEKKKEELAVEADGIEQELTNLRKQAEEYQNSPEYKKKVAERENIREEIKELEQSTESYRKAFEDNIARFERNIAEMEKKLSRVEQYEKGQERIEELKAQEKKLAREYEKLEEELFLCEEFTRTKVDMLENKINGRFKLAHFKLFEEQVNGGLKEVCETLVNGVPYSTNLNTGARINVGIDIINTLAEHYDFYAPIFVDNAESVTEIIPADSQMIKLIVSEDDKELRVEVV